MTTVDEPLTCNHCPTQTEHVCTCCELPHCPQQLWPGPYWWMRLCPTCITHGTGPCPTDRPTP